MVKMHPNLVSPATVQLALDQTCVLAGAKDAIPGFGGAAARSGNRHALSMHRMPADIGFDDSRTFAQFSANEREINLFYRARRKLRR